MGTSLQCDLIFDFKNELYGGVDSEKVRVWQIPAYPNLTHQALVDHAKSWGVIDFLTSYEQELVGRYYLEEDRNRKLISQIALRVILSEYLMVDPKELEFGKSEFGKPFIDLKNRLQFNLTHSYDYIYLAVGESIPLGIDLEYVSPTFEYEELLELVFQPDEIDQIQNSNNPLMTFFQYWTRKEAFLKAVGYGFSIHPQAVPVNIGLNVFGLTRDLGFKHWRSKTFEVVPDYILSIALASDSSFSLHFEEWDFFKEVPLILK
ncbi:4'-phosphopantetheinyl transferase family protein [Belliella kenyensis]|uniref:4'-phosphopantetheinyl transferase family protein n=1 Tax=Belliella kenyensis TaxID=1472724 RepID=A0ABV8EPD4_9BACT|nr:4'-phosphopantetheinyl transferase superfamily protein [Belliella kenyensis]MCH7403665.1 4'-phosphopantetheinyl transferase superfamily protein [Belliella kenyensis]MDN3602181.1 4'-phosphopantetheinyl transferase superfamily protein [Belliella kenyensis]